MGLETAAAIALAAESAAAASAATAAAAAGTAGAAAGAGALGATAAGAAGTAAATGAAGAAAGGAAGLTAAEVAGGAIAAESAAAGGAAAAASGVSPASLAFANTVSTFGGDGLSALIAAEGGFGSTSTMMGAAGDMFAGTAVGDVAKAATSGGQEQQAAPAKPAANTGPATARPNQNPGLTQASNLMAPTQDGGQVDMGTLLPLSGYQNGGQVGGLSGMFPANIFDQTRMRREQEAGLTGGGQGVTININSGGGGSTEQAKPKAEAAVPRSEAQVPGLDQFAAQVLNLIRGESAGYANGGTVRSGAADVKAGGEIRGPESKDGRDNQIIRVAGGEGILPKDVMEVPGIPELVQTLIKTFHTPLN